MLWVAELSGSLVCAVGYITLVMQHKIIICKKENILFGILHIGHFLRDLTSEELEVLTMT